MDSDGQLIELVEQFSFIYDKKHLDFKNKQMKENAWQTIAKVMNDTVESVSARWVILRSRYATERRKEKTVPSGSGAYATWHLFRKMGFLDKFYNPRRTLGNVPNSPNQLSCSASQSPMTPNEPSNQSSLWNDEIMVESDVAESEELETETENSACASTVPDAFTLSSTPRILQEHNENLKSLRGKRNKSSKVFEETITKAFNQISSFLEVPEPCNDVDDLFAMSVGKTLQLFKNKQNKARAKIEILEILEKYTED